MVAGVILYSIPSIVAVYKVLVWSVPSIFTVVGIPLAVAVSPVAAEVNVAVFPTILTVTSVVSPSFIL